MTEEITKKLSIGELAQKELASRVLSKRRLLPFVQRMNPQYDAGWVHEDICERLEKFSQDIVDKKSPRLMLLMPPRAGKSELASKMFPPWHLGRNPNHEFICAAYNISLMIGFSKKIKDIIDSTEYQTTFDTRLDPMNRSNDEWGTLAGGAYVAAGVGGGITGKGAHALVVDDPIRNSEDSESAGVRESLWDWYGSTAYTRLAPGGGVLVIQTWWHDDDLAGRLQEAMTDPLADQFDVVKYPAIAEADEYHEIATKKIVRFAPDEKKPLKTTHRLLRKRGEALHPERFDYKRLMQIKRTISPKFWSALYQQNPVPEDGAFFTKDMFTRGEMPWMKNYTVRCTWDFAISEKRQNDYTVGTVIVHDEDDILHVAEQVAFKSGDVLRIVCAILDLAQKWHHRTMILGFEDGQIWRTMEAVLRKEMRSRRVYPTIEVLKPLTDKKVRAGPLQGRMQQGMVSFNNTGNWYEETQREMLRFPSGTHDDRVDSLAWGAQLCLMHAAPKATVRKKKASWRDRLHVVGIGDSSHMGA